MMARPSCSSGDSRFAAPIPLIGLYIAGATLVCLALMLCDIISSFRRKTRYIPCKWFSLNSATLTLLAIASKLPVDLTTYMPSASDQLSKLTGTTIVCISMCFLMPSLAINGKSESISNMIALSLLVVTIAVNICIQIYTGVIFSFIVEHIMILCCMLLFLPVLWTYTSLVINEKINFNETMKNTLKKREESSSLLHQVKLWYMSSSISNPQYFKRGSSGTVFKREESSSLLHQLYYLETLNVEHCRQLEGLPRDTWKLTNLRHLYIGRNTKLPKWFGRLCCLQTISPFLCLGEENDECGIGELEHLNNISGHLRIDNMEKVRNTMYAHKAKLREKEKIHRLQMLWDNEHANDNIADGIRNNYSEVAEALDPPPNLRELSMMGFPGVKLPLTTWLANGSKPYLVKIEIQGCHRLQKFPSIWNMQPSLEILEISWMSRVKLLGGKCTSTKAPAVSRLKRLSLSQMAGLEEWVDGATTNHSSFPYLEELIVNECDKLRTTPSQFPALKQLELKHVNEEGVSSMLSSPMSLTSLEKLEISCCQSLSSIGDVTGLPCLEKLCIESCQKLTLTLASFPSLQEIHLRKIYNVIIECSSAIDDCRCHHLTSLTSLHVEDVPEFTAVPKGFLQSSSSEHLQSIFINSCNKFTGFVDVEGPELPLLFPSNLKQIKLDSCSNLESINVRGLTSLETLQITHCKGLKSSIIGLQSLQALKYLTLQKVPIIMLAVISGECCWPHLETLNISSSRNVTLATQFPSLRVIEITSIDSVIMEPIATNKDLASLTRLNIVGVKNFTSLPRGLLQNCSMSLKKLRIQNCSMFQGFIQHELLLLTSLEEFCIKSCPVLSSLELSRLVSLTKLKITDCKGIKSSPFPPENLQCLPSLQSLSIGGFSEELDHLPFPAVRQNNNDSLLCSSLQKLKICGWSKIKSLPHQLQHLTALQLLDMRQFDSLAALPEWIGNLSSLLQLDISDSRGPMRLPSKQQLQRLTSLGSITITNCPLLSKRLITDYEERCKISDKYDLSHDRIGHCTHLSLNWSEITKRYGSTTRRPF